VAPDGLPKAVSGDTTEYVLNLAATLPVVISDTEAVYLYGLDIIAQQQAERLYYVHDGLGSVRQLVDTTGQIETNYAYDPFGVPVVGGEVYNPYQFTGEAWDAEVELLYLRARYYQPEVGRFITKDPWEGDPWRPGTLNQYVYVRNNPANLADPIGLWGCPEGGCQPQPLANRGLRRWAEVLVSHFDIIVGEEWTTRIGWQDQPVSLYILWSNWHEDQLKLVYQAATDFAVHMQGYVADFRSKVGPVPLYKREGPLEIPFMGGVGGFTNLRSVTLPGTEYDWIKDGGASMKGTIVHEMAHMWDLHTGWGGISREMASGFWAFEVAGCQVPAHIPVSGLPIVRDWQVRRERQWLNPAEDWADSVFAYVYPWYAHQERAEISESRWYFVASRMNPGNPGRYEYPPGWRSIRFNDTLLREIDPPKISAEDRSKRATDWPRR
jgi:RHS repeat-associated protein